MIQVEKWRPEGWVNPYSDYFNPPRVLLSRLEVFEAGADAVLEGLKRDKETAYIDRYNEPKGYLVFIPEE